MKQIIPEQATVVPLGRWSHQEYQVLCSIDLSVSLSVNDTVIVREEMYN